MTLSAPELLSEAHDLSQFSCGKSALDNWLRTHAISNQRKGFTVVMVVHEAGRVVGYSGLSPTAIVPASLPRPVRTGQPPDPVACLLLGQLATDLNWLGQGIGTGLLKHALSRSVQGASLVGGRALIVNAIEEEAMAFWLRRGFLQSKDDPMVLSRSILDIAASLEQSGMRDGAP